MGEGRERVTREGETNSLSLDGRGIKGEDDIKLADNITQIAKNLRKTSTFAERLLWRHLRAKQVEGYKFRRQEPIGDYAVDFVCFEKRIIIEVDGSQHQIEKDKDKKRDKWFKEQGFRVLRFWNNEVLRNIEGVLELIRESCLDHPPPTPSHQGRGKTNN
jgi:very-short-patch-repair endonuclease